MWEDRGLRGLLGLRCLRVWGRDDAARTQEISREKEKADLSEEIEEKKKGGTKE